MQAASDSTPLWLPAPPAGGGAGGVAPHALEELDMRPAEHVPVYVMLPLDTVRVWCTARVSVCGVCYAVWCAPQGLPGPAVIAVPQPRSRGA